MYSCSQKKKSSYPKIRTMLRILVEILKGSNFVMSTFNILTYALSFSLCICILNLINPVQNFYFFSFSNLRRPLSSCIPSSQPHHLTWFPHPPPDTHANLLLQLYALLSSLDLTKTCMVLFMLWTNKENNTCL